MRFCCFCRFAGSKACDHFCNKAKHSWWPTATKNIINSSKEDFYKSYKKILKYSIDKKEDF